MLWQPARFSMMRQAARLILPTPAPLLDVVGLLRGPLPGQASGSEVAPTKKAVRSSNSRIGGSP